MKSPRVLVAILVATAACDREGPQERRIISTSWDTIFQIGSDAAADTVLLEPFRIRLVNDRLVVIDLAPKVSVFSARNGALLWQFTRSGRGPGELDAPLDAQLSPAGDLWVLDPLQSRILEFDSAGMPTATHSLKHLGGLPHTFLRVGDRMQFLMLSNGKLVTAETTLPDFRPIAERPFPWPDSIPLARKRHLFAAAADRDGGAWAIGFTYGPGFVVWDRSGRAAAHRYIDNIPFDPAVRRIPPGGGPAPLENDTSRWGAHQISIANGELFMLFGGRPENQLQTGEPIELIDVYAHDGSYRRSYRLPYPVRGMTTDGTTFYVLTMDPYPMLQALRPTVPAN